MPPVVFGPDGHVEPSPEPHEVGFERPALRPVAQLVPAPLDRDAISMNAVQARLPLHQRLPYRDSPFDFTHSLVIRHYKFFINTTCPASALRRA
jgi:hypothetical protein